MEETEGTHQLLREIRDAQRESLEEYRRTTARALELQESAVARQEQVVTLYRRLVAAGGIVVAGLIALLVYLLALFL